MGSAYASVCEFLDTGGAVVTATRRQQHELTHAYARWQQQRGLRVWATPDILPWNPWLQRSWQRLTAQISDTPQLLGEAQSLSLWRRVVTDADGESLLDPRQAAQSARQAYALLLQWRLTPDRLRGQAAALNLEQSTFLGWLERYLQACRESHWSDGESLGERLLALDARPLTHDRLGLYGFAEQTPLQAAIVQWLSEAGTEVRTLTPRAHSAKTHVHVARDPGEELDALCAWVLERLADDPAARLGVILPEALHPALGLRRQLDERLHPELQRLGATFERRYALGASAPLASAPVVTAALDLLTLCRDEAPFETVSAVLRSPYLLGADTELSARALLEVELRRRNLVTVPRRRLLQLAREQALTCPLLSAGLDQVDRDFASARERRWPSDWSVRFATALKAGGWPDGRVLDSAEFQSARRFRECFGTLGGLDGVLGRLTLGEALRELQQLTSDVSFQPEEDQPQLLVLDAHVDPMLELDGLWVAGLTADLWPAPAIPHPLLPPQWQVRLGMPHASAAVELAFAKRTQAGWSERAAELVLSWPEGQGELEFDASPLLPAAPAPLAEFARRASQAERLRAAGALETYVDPGPARWPEGRQLPGGTGLLELQAKCPFRAAAEHRLHATPLPSPQPGIDPRVRGLWAHAALAELWARLKDQAGLQSLSPTQRAATIALAIEHTVRELPAELRELRIVALERLWLQRALEALLLVELDREPFTVIQREARTQLSLGEHTLDVRIDRVDRLADGTVAVIDYKTGAAKQGSWFGARPEQPQLPTYAAHLGEPCGAVAFAELTLGRSRFKGLAARAGVLPDVPTTATVRLAAARGRPWASVLEEWSRTTAALADAFAAGAFAVDPTPTACRYCHLSMLCRIETRAVDEGSAAEAPDDE